MKSDRLQDALGNVDDELLLRTEKTLRAKRKPLFILSPIAAVLAICICIGFLLSPKPPSGLVSHAQTVAEYPTIPRFPGYSAAGTPLYREWENAVRAQYAYKDASYGLEDFLASTAPIFLKGSEGKNRVYSPLNVYLALAILAETSHGSTRNEILTLLGQDSIENLRTQAHGLWNFNYANDGLTTSILASSLWLNEGPAFKEETLRSLATNYYVSSFSGSMGSDAMNGQYRTWLNSQTNGYLSEHVANEKFSPNTAMAISSTFYFQSRWGTEFDPLLTKDAVFHSPSGDRTLPFMHQKMNTSSYYWGERFSATHLSLQSGGEMYFILPEEGTTPEELLCDAEVMRFITSREGWENRSYPVVNLSLPKFDVQSDTSLKEGLQSMGVTECFDPQRADFSSLFADDEGRAVESIDHTVRITVDEEGVTAAAFTTVLIMEAVPPPEEIDFVLNRPFLFLVAGPDGTPLFIGTVYEP